MAKQTVIFIFRSSGNLNGTERVLLNWCRYINNEKVNIAVCAHKGPMWKIYNEEVPHVKLYDFWFDNGCRRIKKFIQTYRFFKNLGVSKVVWLLNGMGDFELSEILAGWVVSRGNMYLSHHNFSHKYAKIKPRLWFGFIPGIGFWRINAFLKWHFIHFLAKRVLVISEGVRGQLESTWKLRGSKMKTGCRGVDANVFYPSAETRNQVRSELGLTQAQKVFIAINRFTEQKRVDRALGAFLKILQFHKEVYFIIAGEGEFKERLENKVRLNPLLKENVKFLGYQKDIVPFLQCVDFLLLASDYEGEGNVIKEAMACGVIPISTDSYGPRGIKGTIFFSGRNVFDFYRAIEKALSLTERELEQIREKNLHIARDMYDIKKCAINEVSTFDIPVKSL